MFSKPEHCSDTTITNNTGIDNKKDYKINDFTEILSFVAQFYNNPIMLRNCVQFIMNECSNLLNSEILDLLSNLIFEILNKYCLSELDKQNIEKYFKIFFINFLLNTDVCNFLRNCLIKSVDHAIGNKTVIEQTSREVVYNSIEIKIHFMPLRKIFKKILELPDVFDTICHYTNYLKTNNSNIENFVQSDFYIILKTPQYYNCFCILMSTNHAIP